MPILRWIRELGLLRLLLLFCAVVALILIPLPGTRATYSGWPLFTTVLVPVLVPMLFLVLLLDALMTRVFMADADAGARRRLRTIAVVNLVAAVALLIRWLPFYAAVRV